MVKHEAIAVRASRLRLLGHSELDVDSQDARTEPSPDERVLAFERLARSAEALQRLKPQEVRALWLKAQGVGRQRRCETRVPRTGASWLDFQSSGSLKVRIAARDN